MSWLLLLIAFMSATAGPPPADWLRTEVDRIDQQAGAPVVVFTQNAVQEPASACTARPPPA
jgi:hypothetical protein